VDDRSQKGPQKHIHGHIMKRLLGRGEQRGVMSFFMDRSLLFRSSIPRMPLS
jgi:hypothetical protein